MSLQELVKQRLRGEEGWRPTVYDDATGAPIRPGSHVQGHPTIGYGFAFDVAGLDKEEAEWLLDRRVGRLLTQLQRLLPFWSLLDDVRRCALAEMAYQMGPANLMLFRRALQALATGDTGAAGAHFRDSEWYRQQTPARAERVVQMIETGRMPGEA